MSTISQKLGGFQQEDASRKEPLTWDRFGVSSFPWPKGLDWALTDDVRFKLALDGWYCW